MSFINLNLILKTDRPTDRPSVRPTNLSIEATCRRLKIEFTKPSENFNCFVFASGSSRRIRLTTGTFNCSQGITSEVCGAALIACFEKMITGMCE